MKLLCWIALGSGLGGACRYALDEWVMLLGADAFPLSTLLINISGSLLIGVLAGRWAAGEAADSATLRWHFWITGLCGGYTTFSTLSWQLLEMMQSGHGQAAGMYAAASVGFGLIAVWLGLSLGMRRHAGAES